MEKILDPKSLKILDNCDTRLIEICKEAITITPFKVICGHRSKTDQDKAFKLGNTKVKYPNSKHNKLPSIAIDIVPNPLDWNNIESFVTLSKVILEIAKEKNINLRWGGDWNKNGEWKDEKFRDMPHFELV